MIHKLKNLPALMLIVFSIVIASKAQTNGEITAEQRKQANDFYTAQNWTKAVEAYEAISKAEPQNANALYRVGFSRHNLKQYKQAIEAWERSEKINSNPFVTYNLACAYALSGDKEKALWWLDKAIDAGYTDMKNFKVDTDLDSLRGTKEFKDLEAKMDKASRPCEFNPSARQFDFWIGDWDVKTQQGGTAGTNTIQKLENGCILLENWTSALGGSGKSINFFDTQINKWRQIWVDSTGNSTNFIGEFKDGVMRYEAEVIGKDGKKTLSRLTFTPIDKTSVRQHGESSDDNGKTWKTTYDLIYILKQTGAK